MRQHFETKAAVARASCRCVSERLRHSAAATHGRDASTKEGRGLKMEDGKFEDEDENENEDETACAGGEDFEGSQRTGGTTVPLRPENREIISIKKVIHMDSKCPTPPVIIFCMKDELMIHPAGPARTGAGPGCLFSITRTRTTTRTKSATIWVQR